MVDGSGAPLPPDAEGELQIRGVGLFHGYLDETLNGDVSFTDDGWFRTGDVGRLDTDGYVTVTGRLKDIIIRKGENISAKAIEDLLYADPKIADAAVIGVADAERGEMVCAVVTLADPGDPITLDEIAEYMTEAGTMRQKIPERLEIIDDDAPQRHRQDRQERPPRQVLRVSVLVPMTLDFHRVE